MKMMNRRQVVQSCTIAIPIFSGILPAWSFGQTGAAPVKSVKPTLDNINPELVAYINDQLAQHAVAQSKSGKLPAGSSDVVRLLAQHVDDLNLDAALSASVKQLAASSPITITDPLASPAFAGATAAIRKHQPSFDLSQTGVRSFLPVDQTHWRTALQHVATVGVGNSLRTIADAMKLQSAGSPAAFVTSAYGGHSMSYPFAEIKTSSKARFMLIGECSAADKKKMAADCDSLAGLSVIGILVLAVILCSIITWGVGAALCVAAGAEGAAGGLFISAAVLAVITTQLYSLCQLYLA